MAIFVKANGSFIKAHGRFIKKRLARSFIKALEPT